MKLSLRLFAVVFFGLAVGCVVIPNTFDANINVTIRHIEEQAGEFWGDVAEGAAADKESSANAIQPSMKWIDAAQSTTTAMYAKAEPSYVRRAVNFLSPIQVAYAAEDSTSPRMEQIKAKITERFNDVRKIKSTGAVGESNRGMLELVKPENISGDEQKNEVQRIIAAENQDRKALYNEVARLNKDQNMTVATVEQVHAATLMKLAKSGDLVQVPGDAGELEKFKATPIGKSLGAQATPNAWVTVP